MTRAIRIHQPGGPEELRWEEVEVGAPGDGQIRLAHSAVGLNYIDVYHRSGLYPLPELPAPDEVLTLELPILPPIRSLTPELLDTLQLVHNLGRVEAILDRSAASDLDTYQELLYLLRHRYVGRAQP